MVRIQDDLFESVNGTWIEKTEIPADKPRIGSFDQLVIDIEENLMADFATLEVDKVEEGAFKEFLKFYQQAGDFVTRDAAGVIPAQPRLEKIKGLTWSSFHSELKTLILNGFPTPFSLSIQPDMKNTLTHALYFGAPSLILPDTTYYAEDHADKAELLKVYQEMLAKLLRQFNYSETEIERIITNTLHFDELLVPVVNTSEEWAKYSELYNLKSWEAVQQDFSSLPISTVLAELVDASPDFIITEEPRFYQSFNAIVNEGNWELIQSWLIASEMTALGSYLTEEYRQIAGEFSRALSGIKEARKQDKHAYDLATRTFSQAVGLYYGKKYFGDDAKADVLRMTKKMIGIYQERLLANNWLTQATIDKAVVKLGKLEAMIGFPDKLPEIYHKLRVDLTKSLLENAEEFSKLRILESFAKFKQPVDRTEWHMPAHMVNAYFSPTSNQIVFPAAILQAPFYSLEQPTSANYGGIGAVIAHEISHAFDNNGALFDEYGNMNDWWTKEDKAAFEEKQQAMIVEFDGLEIFERKVNGKLIVSENIADNGGMNAALTAAKSESDVDLQAFFKQWAEIWRIKVR
ncbi:MAG: peptidase M13, partial [Streptococcaceae bacterium]|nr:peptidase M13 [Streptococcaceae bacterium]